MVMKGGMNMKKDNYMLVSGLLFLTASIVHLLRFLLNWEVIIGEWNIPTWISLLGAAFAGYLAYSAHNLKKGK